jgi:hypothetical protein
VHRGTWRAQRMAAFGWNAESITVDAFDMLVQFVHEVTEAGEAALHPRGAVRARGVSALLPCPSQGTIGSSSRQPNRSRAASRACSRASTRRRATLRLERRTTAVLHVACAATWMTCLMRGCRTS